MKVLGKLLGARGSGRRLLWLAAAVATSLLIPTVLTVRTVSKQRYDGLRINLAGRQRMLTQKLSKEILLFSQGQARPERVRRTMHTFEKTLIALLRGGPAPLDLSMTRHHTLPPMEDAAIRQRLEHVLALWKHFARHVDDYLRQRREGDLQHIIKTNVALLRDMDRAVSLMQRRSEQHSAFVSNALLFAVLAALLLLGFLLLRKVAQLRTASAHIDKLETLLPICANCKSIRPEGGDADSQAAWVPIEQYLHDEESKELTHSICPACREKLYPTTRRSSS